MSMDCCVVMSTLKMLIKPLCDDDADHILERVCYEHYEILRFSFWINGLTGVWVGDQMVSPNLQL